MKINLPVTQTEYELPDGAILVSTTDLSGHITHCNRGFVEASGFDYSELLGQAHDIVRHPDVPPEAFKDMWSTIGRGRPWTGIVKNRRKNGDHYWVQANVTPVMEAGKPKA
jgi:aerotaxis receptor